MNSSHELREITMTTLDICNKNPSNYSFFATAVQFPEVIDKSVDTKHFLDASTGVVELLDKFGKIFGVVKYDISGNIEKLKRVYSKDPIENSSLQKLIINEKEKGEMLATDALMWLRRGLHYFSRFIEGLVNDFEQQNTNEDLSGILRMAYGETLEQYHGWLAHRLFNLICKISPRKSDLIKMTCNTATKEQLICDIKAYNTNLSLCINELLQFYITNNLEVLARV